MNLCEISRRPHSSFLDENSEMKTPRVHLIIWRVTGREVKIAILERQGVRNTVGSIQAVR